MKSWRVAQAQLVPGFGPGGSQRCSPRSAAAALRASGLSQISAVVPSPLLITLKTPKAICTYCNAFVFVVNSIKNESGG